MAASRLDGEGFLDVAGQRLDYSFNGPQPDDAPTLVLLHEGLGSAALWGGFRERLAEASGCGVFAYSRAGYGKSSPAPLPRPVTYMHDEACEVLPVLLDTIGLQRGMLVGHSDGASIAAIYAGSNDDPRVAGISLMAPHFFLEEVSIRSIVAAGQAYETTDLREKLARWHEHVDVAFRGWNDAWRNPDFRDWNLTEFLPQIKIPVQVIQGVDDQYGTARQVEVVEEMCVCPVETVMMEGVKHAPYREAPEETCNAIAQFATGVLAGRGDNDTARQ
ncbi:MAG: alpha/beta hydrolase [Hyphomicrobiales bacterium]|nr:alpha/beta hydrolase [Hyphomicrobiales bacterium]